MKVLWLVNTIMPGMARALNREVSPWGGWLEGMLESIADSKKVDLTILSTAADAETSVFVQNGGVQYILTPSDPEKMPAAFRDILAKVHPDIVHIYGTEMPHAFIMTEVAEQYPVLVQIQGLLEKYSEAYLSGMPVRYRHASRLKQRIVSLFGGSLLCNGLNRFLEGAEKERRIFENVRYVLGRTDWDRRAVFEIVPDGINYYHCNENLRPAFYEEKSWNIDDCEQYSIFVSQAMYPIKGLHMLLRALPEILDAYPRTHLYVGGYPASLSRNPLKQAFIDYRCEYIGYLHTLMRKCGLTDAVSFVGLQNETQMRDRFLKAHLFVCCSSIENSPNAVGEAMMLGVPVVASEVGGIPSMLMDEKEGLLYPFDDTKHLAASVMRIFNSPSLSARLSESAKKRAKKTHDRKKNAAILLGIYDQIVTSADSVKGTQNGFIF